MTITSVFYAYLNVSTGWGYHASIEEVMNSLHNLVAAGKVLYLVCSFLQICQIVIYLL